jgi:hypothetical protein
MAFTVSGQDQSKQVTHSLSNVNNIRIHYLPSGNGDKTPVILILHFVDIPITLDLVKGRK